MRIYVQSFWKQRCLSWRSKWNGRFPLTSKPGVSRFTSKHSEKWIFDGRHPTQSCSPTGVLQSRESMRPWDSIGPHRFPKDSMGFVSSRFLSLVSEPGRFWLRIWGSLSTHFQWSWKESLLQKLHTYILINCAFVYTNIKNAKAHDFQVSWNV